MLASVGVFALALLNKEGLLIKPAPIVIAVMLTALALVLRALVFGYETLDYQNFLTRWVDFFRQRGGWRALSEPVGNYNIPYLYFMALFSYSSVKDLYLIKLLSTVFDVLLAYSAMRLVSRWQKSAGLRLGCFFTVLLWPTVFLNSAVWAQCDSIYAFFGIFALYLGLSEKGVGAMISLAACLAFKLQAVFIIPVFFVLLLAKKLRWTQLLIFPAAYIVFMLPAVIAGAPLWDTLTLYFSQAGTVGDAMNYNAPSLTSMFSWSGDTAKSARVLIIAAFLLVAAVYATAILLHKKLSDRVILGFSLILAMGIPYLLPHMHDRYFFIPGVLALVLAASDLRFAPVPVLAELASLHCYYAYFNRYYLVQPRIGGELMLAALLLCIAYTAVYVRKARKFEISP